MEPSPPPNTLSASSVLSDVIVDSQGKVRQITVREGMNPFSDATTRAVRQWNFQPAKVNNRTVESTVGVLMVYRPASFGNSAVGGATLGFTEPLPGQTDHPPLPLEISDTGYPPASTAMGVVVLELTIERSGRLAGIRTVRDIPSLTEIARDAVQSWKFIPAMESGQAIDGSLIVGISFVRPVVDVPLPVNTR